MIRCGSVTRVDGRVLYRIRTLIYEYFKYESFTSKEHCQMYGINADLHSYAYTEHTRMDSI